MRKYWELWKDALAAWAAVALIIYSILLACGMEQVPVQLSYQLQLYFLLSVFFPFLAALPLKTKTSWWSKRRRRILAIICLALTLIFLIICLRYRQTLSISTQALCSIIALALGTIGSIYAFMPVQRQPRQPEEPFSKAKESVEAPSAPKPERAKITDLAALLVLLLAIALTRKKPK